MEKISNEKENTMSITVSLLFSELTLLYFPFWIFIELFICLHRKFNVSL